MNDDLFYLNVRVTHAHGTAISGTLAQGTKAEMLEKMNTLKWDFANTTPASLELVEGVRQITETTTAVIHIIPACFLEEATISMQVGEQPA